MDVDNDDQDEEFAGASSGARAGVVASKCELCERNFTLWSLMTYVEADNFKFAKTPDTRLMKAVDIVAGATEKSNFADPARQVMCVCGLCLETKHGVEPGTYVTKDSSGSMKATTKFRKASKATKGVPLSSKRAEFICMLRDKKEQTRGESQSVSTLAVYQSLSASAALRSSLDWICMLGSWLFLFFGCPSCFLFPLMSNCWYRFQRLVKQEVSGQTGAGEDDGHWRCATCLKKWTWSTGGAYRLLVFGDWNPATQRFDTCQMAFIGKQTDAQNNKINWLKGCNAIETLAGRPITRENILQMIDALNRETNRVLTQGGIREVVRTTARDPNEALLQANCRLYMEDERLSLLGPGRQFNAINSQLCSPPVTEISSEELDDLLDAAAAGLDVESGPHATAAQRQVQRKVMSSPGFIRGRQWLSKF